MKHYIRKLYLLPLLILSVTPVLTAQPRGPMDPTEMIAREKQNLYREVTDLTNDQKLLLDGIYEEYAVSFSEHVDEMRKTRDFEKMRPKMEALRKEKDELIADVLNEEQYARYQKLMENTFMRRGRDGRPGQDSTFQKKDDN